MKQINDGNPKMDQWLMLLKDRTIHSFQMVLKFPSIDDLFKSAESEIIE